MSTTNEDGGPAFPHPELVQDIIGENGYVAAHRVYHAMPGMSLRDWFAGRATNDDIDEHLSIAVNGHPGGESRLFTREQAKYRYADAMLKAREAK